MNMRTIDQKDVRPTVVVVIEQRNAGPCRLEDVPLTRVSAAEMFEVKPGTLGHVSQVYPSRAGWRP